MKNERGFPEVLVLESQTGLASPPPFGGDEASDVCGDEASVVLRNGEPTPVKSLILVSAV